METGTHSPWLELLTWSHINLSEAEPPGKAERQARLMNGRSTIPAFNTYYASLAKTEEAEAMYNSFVVSTCNNQLNMPCS